MLSKTLAFKKHMLLYYYYKKWDLLKWNLLMLNSFIYKGMQQLCLSNFTCEHFNWLKMFWSFECWCTGLSDWIEEPASTLCLLSFFWSDHNSFNQSVLCYQIFEGAKSLRQILKRTQNRFLKQQCQILVSEAWTQDLYFNQIACFYWIWMSFPCQV